jgi:hypothetical protein
MLYFIFREISFFTIQTNKILRFLQAKTINNKIKGSPNIGFITTQSIMGSHVLIEF